jgi:SNF2 family DNA or RNA helicase
VIGDKLSTFPKLDMVWKYGVHPEVARVIRKEVTKFKELKTPIMPYIPPKIDPPAGLKEGFKWHRYQLEGISWMKSIEENTDKELKYCDLVPWRASRSNLLFDLHNEKILTPEAVSDYIGSFKSRGGILADAVGLGKTLEMIGLVLATQDMTLPEFDENGLFNSKASLIVCSGHIAIQWASEIAKFTNLKVKQITNIQEATEATYGDIVNSDFVIVATPLLKNKQFLSLGCSKSIVSLAPKALKTRANYLDGHLEEVKKKKNKLQVTGPPLDNFHFRRIIVDEAHEVFLDNFTLALLINQANNARWYVSATPFPSDDLLEAAKKFLGIWEPDFTLKKTPADQYENFVENDLMMNNLVWRNTKESIQDEYEVPDYEEQVVWIDCHPIEALHIKYDKSSERLCNLDTLKSRAISSIEHKIKWGYHYGSHLEQKQRLQEWKNTPNVKSSTPTKDEQELDEYGSKITKVVAWLKERIEEDESNRFLFFSKNNFILHRLGKLIGENNIPFVSFEGNVNQKVKKLQEFKEDNVKIMLLSLVKSASGLNLIEANHIVLLDPMSGSVEESRAYEIQALGRAHRQGQDQKVKLMRFVMRDTFEEELYNRNKSSGRAAVDDQKGLLKRSSSAIQMLNRSSSAASLREVLAEK